MSLNDLLESDLRTLANEGKKKAGDIKEITEKTISLLRQSDKIPVDNIFLVLSSAKATNNPRLCSLALSILQKLLTSQSLDSLLPALLFLKSLLEETTDESLQLKVLQTLMLLLDPRSLKIFPELTDIIWSIYISLQNNKSSLVRNTASATLRQLINITFHKMQSERDPELISSGCALLRNSCELAKTRNGDLMKLRTEALGLIVDIMQTCKEYVAEVEMMDQLVQGEIVGIVVAGLVEDVEEINGGKYVLCATLLCGIYHGNSELIRLVVRLVENRKLVEWLSLACLEFISTLVASPLTVKFIYNDSELHMKLLDSLSKVSHELFAQTEDLRQPGTKAKVRLISEIVSRWVESVAIISEESGIKLGETSSLSDTLPEKILTAIWKQLLPILSIMVANSNNESILQTMLNSYQTLINLAGTLNMSSAREALLASLCQFCIPSPAGTLNHKHMHICKTLFNITHCLGFVLDSKAWHKVLDTLYKLDFLLNNSSKQEDLDLSSDISILCSAMESLFRNTHIWPDSTIVDLMSALGQLTLEFMETLATNDKKLASGKVFGIEKMIIVGQNNLDRIDLYWDSLSAYLDCICNSKYHEIRTLGTNSIMRIIISAFKRFIETAPSFKAEKWNNWQRTLMLALHDLLGSPHVDTQEAVFVVLNSILQVCGGQLDSGGWSMLLFILSKINLASSAREGFKCLQLIISDFLQSESLYGSLERLLTCVSRYAHAEDTTHAIGAVGMYWNVVDYLGKLGKGQVELWWMILEELKSICEDPRMELRQSALSSLHVALATHGSLLAPNSWQRVMKDIILDLFARISANYFRNSKSLQKKDTDGKKTQGLYSDSNEKQWEETFNIFTQNLGKIFRTYLNSLHKQEREILEEETVQRNWDVMFEKLNEGVLNGTLHAITAVLKTIKEFLLCPLVAQLFFIKWESSWEVFVSLGTRFENSGIQIHYKLISTILEVLGLVYASESKKAYEGSCLVSTFSILGFLLRSTTVECGLSLAKLLPEQREVWEFIENMLEQLIAHGKGVELYAEFLLKFVRYEPEDSNSDGFCRKALEVIEILVSKYHTETGDLVFSVLSAYERLISYRFTNEGLSQTAQSSKGAQSIWLIAEESFLNLFFTLTHPEYLSKTADILQGFLTPSEKLINKLSKSNLDSMSKAAEATDIKFLKALAEFLLNNEVQNSQVLNKLISIIDIGCDSYYKAIHAQELILQESFSNVCFASLLELTKTNSKNSNIAANALVNRCKDMILRFSKEDKLSGQMPLPKIKLLEMLDVLNAIRKLEISTDALQKPGKKGHLLEIFPQLCEMITVKDVEVKEALKKVFLEISRNI